jgi:hypothetical protein
MTKKYSVNRYTNLERVFSSKSSIQEVREIVKNYLSVRNNCTNLSSSNTTETDIKNKQTVNMFEFLRPTGWYKDEVMLDIDKRSDKRTPKNPHPLSFTELEKYGFQNLSTIIMDLGGPLYVGNMLGIEWTEPSSSKPKSVLSKEKSISSSPGKLVLGSALDETLDSSASILNLSELKEMIAENDSTSDGVDLNDVSSSNILTEIDYSKMKSRKGIQSSSITALKERLKIDKSEKFRLDRWNRLYLVMMLGSGAISFGHASHDLISITHNDKVIESVIKFMQYLFPTLLTVSVASGIRCGWMAKQNNRNILTWSLRSFLGGPKVMFDLKQLDQNLTIITNSIS